MCGVGQLGLCSTTKHRFIFSTLRITYSFWRDFIPNKQGYILCIDTKINPRFVLSYLYT